MVTKIAKVGSRAQVMHGTAMKTSGGLTKKDLKYNKWGSRLKWQCIIILFNY